MKKFRKSGETYQTARDTLNSDLLVYLFDALIDYMNEDYSDITMVKAKFHQFCEIVTLECVQVEDIEHYITHGHEQY